MPLAMMIPAIALRRSLGCMQLRGYAAAAGEINPRFKHLVPSSGTYPVGFRAAGLAAGIKKKQGMKDMALVVTDPSLPCVASGVFTTNQFQAAAVTLDKEILATRGDMVFGVVTNAGNANACTGDKGMEDARATSEAVTALAKKTLGASDVGPTCVMSTGVIGQHLPMDKINAGIAKLVPALSSAHESWLDAAKAIMTTDTFPKLRTREIALPSGTKVRFAGMCKGAGMIHPNMATMLSTVYTDALVSKPLLDEAVRYAADWSFNAISVDGDMSTNDTFMVLANGGSKGTPITDKNSEDYKVFRQNLKEFSEDLAQLVVRDGEGATKFITVHVEGARSFAEAKRIASSVATSSLVKTAFYGQDANWGRIMCAVGYSGVPLDPTKVSMRFVSGDGKIDLHIFKDGAPFDTNEDVASSILKGEDIVVRISLGLGSEEAKMYTCDFSTEYVHINADYRS
ncbi:ArgJ family protein [Hyaloraphidium curvatum]|nr:ArgJ family protein [Hyaloraphidium curvatum]